MAGQVKLTVCSNKQNKDKTMSFKKDTSTGETAEDVIKEVKGLHA